MTKKQITQIEEDDSTSNLKDFSDEEYRGYSSDTDVKKPKVIIPPSISLFEQAVFNECFNAVDALYDAD